MADQIVRLGPEYFPRPTSGRPVAGGSIYIGEPDTDPEIPANQITVSAMQESGTTVDIDQPILTSGGGTPLYNGSDATLLVSESYSLKVLDSFGVQVYYVPSTDVPVDTQDPVVEYIKDLIGLINVSSPTDNDTWTVLSFFDGLNEGGDDFYWSSTTDKATANGGTIVDPDNIGGFDGTTSTLSAFLTAQGNGVGFGCWVRITENLISVTKFGAVGDGVTDDTAPLQAAFSYCAQNSLNLFVGGGTYLFTDTIDTSVLSSERTLKLVGDSSGDSNGIDRHSLLYTGSGVAIKCALIVLDRVGLAGTALITSTIPAATTAIQASESILHINSSIRNFNIAYDVLGGFYHRFIGGRINRCRVCYNFGAGISIFNFYTNLMHTNFEYGVKGSATTGGNGPCVMAGSYEKWTRSVYYIENLTNEIGLEFQAPYIENYPDTTVSDGITPLGGETTYVANNIANIGKGSFKGTGTLFAAGLQDEFFLCGQCDVVETAFDLYDTGHAKQPPYVYNEINTNSFVSSLRARAAYRQGTFSGFTAVLSTSLISLLNGATGTYTDFDGKVNGCTGTRVTANLLNGWTVSGDFSMSVVDGVVTLYGIFDASAATADTVFVLPDTLWPKFEIRRVINVADATFNYSAFIRILTNGEIRLLNMDSTSMTTPGIRLSVTYSL